METLPPFLHHNLFRKPPQRSLQDRVSRIIPHFRQNPLSWRHLRLSPLPRTSLVFLIILRLREIPHLPILDYLMETLSLTITPLQANLASPKPQPRKDWQQVRLQIPSDCSRHCSGHACSSLPMRSVVQKTRPVNGKN